MSDIEFHMKIYTIANFIEKSQRLFADHYKYELVEYKSNRKQVTLKCNFCSNTFPIRPDSHFVSPHGGCRVCHPIDRASRIRTKMTKEEFIAEANRIHNNKYDYSQIKFRILSDVLDIKCDEHGFFKQTGSKHIRDKHGCTPCGERKRSEALRFTRDEVIEIFTKIHGNKYGYDKFIEHTYIGEKQEFYCFKHKKYFKQKVSKHMFGQGCPLDSIGVSKVEVEWLDYLKVPQEFRNKSVKINDRRFKPDAIDEDNKIIWEFNGDFWHGNPDIFDPDAINSGCKVTFGEKYQKTLNKQKFLEDAGYTVISIWENIWIKLRDSLPPSDPQSLPSPLPPLPAPSILAG